MKKSMYLLFMVFAFFSCNTNEEFFIEDETKADVDTNFVELREAISIATLLEFDVEGLDGLRSTTYLEVEETTPIGSGEKPSYYVINYKDNSGFVILAADKRADPVLAYSTENGFDTDTQDMPGGLLEWMAGADGYIHDLREGNIEGEPRLRSTIICDALKSVSTTRAALPEGCYDITDGGCPLGSSSREYVAPLLKTQWHQGPGFNNRISYICGKNGERPPAGCVAIAVAQVMYYHKHPSSYDWNSMSTLYGGGEAPHLIRDINTPNNLDMEYGCDGSGTELENAVRTFENFGYDNAVTYGDFDIEIIKNQLRYKKPVILRGRENQFLFWSWEGHAWVCDGLDAYNTCTHSTLQLHMNWGWLDGQTNNGWYGINNIWNPRNTDSNYKYDHKMVYNIKP